jgi:hypothetical protein
MTLLNGQTCQKTLSSSSLRAVAYGCHCVSSSRPPQPISGRAVPLQAEHQLPPAPHRFLFPAPTLRDEIEAFLPRPWSLE